MSVAEMMKYIWSLLSENGYTVFDTFISFADVLIFVIVGSLLMLFVCALLGGKD